jgi:hypothetical protein
MKAADRAVELKRQINALYRRRGEIEVALQYEHVAQERAAAKRTLLLAELPGADDALTGYTHAEVDKIEETLRLSARVAEGLESSHAKVVNETASLEAEQAEATRIVEQENHERGLAALRKKLEDDTQTAEAALAAVRLALAALNLTASRGVEQYGVAGQNLVLPVLEAFRHRANNPGSFGWQESRPNYGGFRFSVEPMAKKP